MKKFYLSPFYYCYKFFPNRQRAPNSSKGTNRKLPCDHGGYNINNSLDRLTIVRTVDITLSLNSEEKKERRKKTIAWQKMWGVAMMMIMIMMINRQIFKKYISFLVYIYLYSTSVYLFYFFYYRDCILWRAGLPRACKKKKFIQLMSDRIARLSKGRKSTFIKVSKVRKN